MYTKRLISITLVACIAHSLTYGNLLQATKYKQEAAEKYEGIEDTLMGTDDSAKDDGNGNRRNNKQRYSREKQSRDEETQEKQGKHEKREGQHAEHRKHSNK